MLTALRMQGEKSGPRALLLGSFPSEESLKRQQYYAHPRNMFWPLLAATLGEEDPREYPSRVKMLRRNRLALCDVIGGCLRKGSLDSAIKKASANKEVAGYLRRYPRLPVLFTSQHAARLFERLFPESAQERLLLRLPSPSPTNARQSFSTKKMLWKRVFSKLLNADAGRGQPA